jgi:hypothetical protein
LPGDRRPRRKSWPLLWLLVPLLGAGPPPNGAAPLPRCGVPQVDLGDGFHAALYMFAGSPEFMLTYDVPRSAIVLHGATLGEAFAPRIVFYAVDAPPGEYRSLHIENSFDVRDQGGRRITSYIPHVECGEGRTLDTTDLVPSDEQVRACFEAMQRTGGFRISFLHRASEPPFFVAEGQWPLHAKIAAVRARWRSEIERFRLDQCRLMQPPPPPD